jgi:Putative ABC-transporter type IV
MTSPRRPLLTWERSLAYSAVGVATEVVFTSARDSVLRRDWSLKGRSYLWMFPIYGLSAYLFEPVHDALRERPWWERAVAYSVGIMGVEYLSGSAIKRLVGAVPWDYSGHGRFVLPGGATRLDYAPLWAVAGLALERMHDAMDNVTVSDR